MFNVCIKAMIFEWILVFLQCMCVIQLVESRKSKSEIPHACPNVTTLFIRNRCYWVSNKKNNFDNSHRVCGQNGGVLAEMPDQVVEKTVIKHFGDVWRWIGVQRFARNDTMMNMLNKRQGYTNWDAGEPSPKLYDDSVILTRQGWRLIPKSMTAEAICSKRVCMCSCERTRNQVIVENNSDLQAKIRAIKQELSIKTRKLSKTLRKKTCAADFRISSTLIGTTSGLILFIGILSLAILFDLYQKDWRCLNCFILGRKNR